MQFAAPLRLAQHGIAILRMPGVRRPVKRAAGVGLGCPVMVMLFTLFKFCAKPGSKHLRHLVVHQDRQAIAKRLAQCRREGNKATQRCPASVCIASVMNFADDRLFVGDKGVARATSVAPDRLRVSNNHLGLVGHPGVSRAHGFAYLAIQRRCEIDVFFDEAWRHCQHYLFGLYGFFCPGAAEMQFCMVAAIGNGSQLVAQLDCVAGQGVGERGHQRCHAACDPPCATMDGFAFHTVGRLVRIGEAQHSTRIVLNEAGKAKLCHQTANERLGFRPVPGRPQVSRQAIARANRRQDASAKPRARLEYTERAPPLRMQAVGQRQAT